jgi:GrpB-like predicted nucleotidyltransferase (UPF0157 family)
MPLERVTFHRSDIFSAAAARVVGGHTARLQHLLPHADIQHIGSTAIPGRLTKGDVDLVVRVAPARFAESEQLLAAHYARNEGSDRTPDFAAFKDDNAELPLGIQLAAISGSCDDFVRFRNLLRARPSLAYQYDAIKRQFNGRGMDEYRAAKGEFVERVLGLPRSTN